MLPVTSGLSEPRPADNNYRHCYYGINGVRAFYFTLTPFIFPFIIYTAAEPEQGVKTRFLGRLIDGCFFKMISLACRIREAHPTSLPWLVGTLPLTHQLPKRQSIVTA
jgi:hypothetical protein